MNAAPAMAQSKDLYPADRDAMQKKLLLMLNTPTPQIDSWSGPNGDGDITVSMARSSTQGMPCSDLATCASPCRNYSFTFVGERQDGWIVNEERTAKVCMSSSGQWSRQGREELSKSTELNLSPRKQAELDEQSEQRKLDAERRRKLEEDRQKREQEDIARHQAAAQAAAKAQQAEKDKLAAVIRDIQDNLIQLHYMSGPADGVLGVQSINALQSFLDDERIGITLGRNPDISTLETVLDDLEVSVQRLEFTKPCPLTEAEAYRVCF